MTTSIVSQTRGILCFVSLLVFWGGMIEPTNLLCHEAENESFYPQESECQSDLSSQAQARQEPAPPKSQVELEMELKQKKAQRKEEYEKTKKVAEQILKLSQELKELIDKAGQDTLPLAAVRKAEEIESLLRRLKTRLKEGT